VSEVHTHILATLANRKSALLATEAAFEANKPVLLPILEKLGELGSEPIMYAEDVAYASMYGDVDKMVDAIRALKAAGFEPAEKPDRKSSSYCTYWRKSECPVAVLFSFTSSVCRRVKVGTRTETVDVYEIECGGSDIFKAEPETIANLTEIDSSFF
jgi:hypothetical protein